MSEEQLPQFCPACGAGVVERTATGVIYWAPTGWPVRDYCDECKRGSGELGRKMAQELNDRFWKAFTSDSLEQILERGVLRDIERSAENDPDVLKGTGCEPPQYSAAHEAAIDAGTAAVGRRIRQQIDQAFWDTFTRATTQVLRDTFAGDENATGK